MVFGPRWLADPAWRPLFEWGCARLQSVGASCALPPLVEVRLLALEAHQFTTHPQREGGLLFEAELVNRAPFAQPYPRIRLSVEDPFGGSMAIGTFPRRGCRFIWNCWIQGARQRDTGSNCFPPNRPGSLVCVGLRDGAALLKMA
jgi:hypothetical protein